LAWLTLLVVVVSLTIALCPDTSETRIRLTGLVLQLLGVGTVGFGIAKTRRFYGKPGVFAKAAAWFRRIPRLTRPSVTGAGSLAVGLTNVSASGYVGRVMGAGAKLEERVAALEANLQDLNGRHDETKRLLDKEVRERGEALDAERRARTTAEDEIRDKLELSDTGGLDLSVTGLVWLAVGLSLSTASVEIFKLLGCR
jgi:hypothetical protein